MEQGSHGVVNRMESGITRRDFVAKSAFAAGILFIPNARRVFGANERLSVGIVGAGQRGRVLLNECRELEKEMNAEMTAVCDIWRLNRERAMAAMAQWHGGKPPRPCRNLDEICELKDVDALLIATADFQHARHLTRAVRAGKDVYCEKPMANDLREAKEALRAVRDTKRVAQIGTQRRSDGQYIAAAKMMQTGILGTLCKVDIAWNAMQPHWRRSDVDEAKAEDVDWQRFLMGKAMRPFDPHQFMEWRLYRDFSSGIPDQWMSHLMDVVNWFTGESFPRSAVAQGSICVWKDGRENPDTFQAVYEFPKGFLVSYSTTFGNAGSGDGLTFLGTNGALDTRTMKFSGAGGGEKRIKDDIAVQLDETGTSHLKNWLECVRTRKTPNAPPEAAYGAVVAVAMAVKAMNSGRRTYFDPVRHEIVDDRLPPILTHTKSAMPDVIAVAGKTDIR
jgi:predicted dehydrogenase